MILYALDKVLQRYNGRVALDIDHLEIEGGRIHALLGPNGAGKTTLLNILGFLETPVSGTMLFNGQAVEPSPKTLLHLRRQVVLVDQHPIMFSTTVASNIEFGLKIRKIGKSTRQRMVDEVLATVGLSRYKTARAHELSGGETQRLALARALVLEPEVLLCDEPTASVDTENQAIIISLLQQINTERGTTIIFTTHDRLQAASLAQHTLMLENGRLATTAYENSYTCTFHHNEGSQVHCILQGITEISLPAPPPGWPMLQTGRMHIAPEKITLERHKPQPCTAPPMTGTIILIMAEGKKIRVVVNVGVLMVVLIDQARYAELRPAIGETICLRLESDAISFFQE